MPRLLIPVLFLLFLAACAQPPTLDSKSPVVPQGVDLTGQWVLRDESADTMRQIKEDEQLVPITCTWPKAIGGIL